MDGYAKGAEPMGSIQDSALASGAAPGLALCLSGGGFRATFYHLGVIKLLRDYGLPRRVTHIFSVSGGSIIAAHLAMNWDDYTRPYNESGFYGAAKELVEFGCLDLRGRILRRSLLLGWLGSRFRRTRQLEAYYAAPLRNAELQSTASAGAAFWFLATSLTTGKLCRFTARGFHDGIRLHPAADLPLSFAVAASSAFPPLFPR